MDRFAEDAASIFKTAQTAVDSGLPTSEVTIVVGREGRIRMISETDWPLDSLLTEHDGASIYRVRQQKGQVRLEGRSGSRSCVFEAQSSAAAIRPLLAEGPQYAVEAAPGTKRALRPAETWLPPPEESD